jgi:hypothetical protein
MLYAWNIAELYTLWNTYARDWAVAYAAKPGCNVAAAVLRSEYW